MRRNQQAAWLLAAVLASTTIILAQAQPPKPASQSKEPQTPFRAGVDLVSLNVTVADGTTHYVTDLAADDFSVFEDGIKQEVTFFTRSNLPIALSLLVDTSASMETKLPTAQEAAIGFVRKLRHKSARFPHCVSELRKLPGSRPNRDEDCSGTSHDAVRS